MDTQKRTKPPCTFALLLSSFSSFGFHSRSYALVSYIHFVFIYLISLFSLVALLWCFSCVPIICSHSFFVFVWELFCLFYFFFVFFWFFSSLVKITTDYCCRTSLFLATSRKYLVRQLTHDVALLTWCLRSIYPTVCVLLCLSHFLAVVNAMSQSYVLCHTSIFWLLLVLRAVPRRIRFWCHLLLALSVYWKRK